MTTLKLEFEGLGKIKHILDKLPDAVAKKVVRKALTAGGQIVLDAMKEKVPVKTGNLRDSLAMKVLDKSEFAKTVLIGASKGETGKDGWYAHLVEFGASPHVVKPRKKSGKKVLAENGKFFGKLVQHPGATARPFMRPAFDETADKALETIKKLLGEGVIKEALKLSGEITR
jgi:HK97 gp10 family phage protein